MDEDNLLYNRTFSEIVGASSRSDAEQLFDPGLDERDVESEGYKEWAEDWSVCDSEVDRELKRAFIEEDSSESVKRFAVSSFPPRVVGETSGAVFDAVASSSKSQIPLQVWEQGVFGYICGNNDLMPLPAIPKLEQPVDLGPPIKSDVVDSSSLAIDKDPVFTSAVKLRARWTSQSSIDARTHVLMRWRAALFHNLEGSEVGHMLRDNDPALHLELLEETFEGKSTNTLAKRVNSLLHYLNYWRIIDEHTPDFLPFTSSLVYGYLKHLKTNNRLSAAKDFLQCTKFCEHVVGLKSLDSLSRPGISGIAKAAYSHVKPKKESRPLTVKEIIQLENFLIKGSGHHLDRYACGVFLCMLYGRARSSDFRNIDKVVVDFCDGSERTGYIEIHTVDYKSARLSRMTGRPFIVLIPVYGLCGESWGKAFVSAATMNGIDLNLVSGPLLSCPDAAGQPTGRYPSANEVTAWVNGILDRLVANRQGGFTSQGLKATMLSWASKAGLGEYDRHVLGGHSMKGRQTAATYARDTLTAPVKQLEEVISSVRHGSFLPDSSRANMFPSGADFSSEFEQKKTADTKPTVVDERMKSGVAIQPDATEDVDPDATNNKEVETVESEDSDSSSSSTSDEGPDDDVAEQCMSTGLFHAQLEQFKWKDNCSIYKHRRTFKLHLKPVGSETSTFLCGRNISDDYKEFTGTIACDSWKCKQCDSCRPLHDEGSMIAHLDLMEARRASRRAP